MTILKKMLEYLHNLWYHNVKVGEVEHMEEKGFTVFDVANFFRTKENMSNKKLQKLTYYAYAWYIALNNEDANNINNRLCENTIFEAWIHGPVCRELYNKIPTDYGMVTKYKGKLNPLIDGEIEKFLNLIYKIFGKYSGDELETMTHQEMPWQNARGTLPPTAPSNKPILESDMFIYYNSL